MILLTKEQADKVRGRHGKYSELDPIESDNEMFILPDDVLNDPEHKEVLYELGECKYANVDILHEVDEILSEEDPLKYKQVFSVKEVSPVKISVEKEITVKPTYNTI